MSWKDYVQTEHYEKDLKEGDSYPESEMVARCYSRRLDLGKSQSTHGMDKRASGECKGSADKRLEPLSPSTCSLLCSQIYHTRKTNISNTRAALQTDSTRHSMWKNTSHNQISSENSMFRSPLGRFTGNISTKNLGRNLLQRQLRIPV